MTRINSRHLLAAAVAATLSPAALALDPMGIKVSEGVSFTPTVELGLSHDDNFRALSTNEQSSWVTRVAPTFALGGDNGKVKLGASYTALHDIFHSYHRYDNTDHLLSGQALFRFDVRNRLDLNASYSKVEDTASLDQKLENDRYRQGRLGALYTYGADTATGQIRLGMNYDRLRYDNGTDPFSNTRINAGKERNSTGLTGTFLYRVAPKTRALIEARYTDHDYVSNRALDSSNTALLVGAEWDATAIVSGSARIGRERKDYDLAGKPNASTGMWEVGLSWAPRTYSVFTLSTRSGFDEGADGADLIKTRSYSLAWDHGWAERLSSKVSLTRAKYDYDRPGAPRKDTVDMIGIGLTYKMRRWLDVGVGYRYTDSDSNQPIRTYERNVIGLTVNASL